MLGWQDNYWTSESVRTWRICKILICQNKGWFPTLFPKFLVHTFIPKYMYISKFGPNKVGGLDAKAKFCKTRYTMADLSSIRLRHRSQWNIFTWITIIVYFITSTSSRIFSVCYRKQISGYINNLKNVEVELNNFRNFQKVHSSEFAKLRYDCEEVKTQINNKNLEIRCLQETIRLNE